MMLNYKEFERSVFDWLMDMHQKDPKITFSLRQKTSKGAESDYFIGTENSSYFGTTFWDIPIGYPSATSDLINLMFGLNKRGYIYNLQFKQTKNPHNNQNKYALELVHNIKPLIKQKFSDFTDINPSNKLEYYKIGNRKEYYTNLAELFDNINADLKILFPIVDKEISVLRKKYSDFKAERFSESKFNEMLERYEKRKSKHAALPNGKQGFEETFPEISNVKDIEIKNPLNQILFGPPGTGKTFNTINKAINIIQPYFDLTQPRSVIKKEYERLVDGGQIVFTTFHQSMSYEDFIEGIKPMAPTIEGHPMIYKVQAGIFKELCIAANLLSSSNFEQSYQAFTDDLASMEEGIELTTGIEKFKLAIHQNGIDLKVETSSNIKNINKSGLKYVSNSQKFEGLWGKYYRSIFNYLTDKYGYKSDEKDINRKYVVIIDEINRGNVSQIFGELITLIEEDKRIGKEEALEVTLPYSKEKFGVPLNLYIIGTLNTADRSVEALDAALRRRFSFEEMPPLYDLEGLNYDIAGIKASDLLKTINKRIEKLLDKDHQIGHSYLLKKAGEDAEQKLLAAFYKNIIPLLQEYFFGDYSKIGLVLGKGFIRRKEWDNTNDSFADFDTENTRDYDERDIYEIIHYTQERPEIVVEMGRNSIDMNFQKAIRLLMKQEIE